MKLSTKMFFAAFILITVSPILTEAPEIWKWAGNNASKKFLNDQSGTSSSPADIQIWGRPGCTYTNRLIESLDKWKFPYTFHNTDLPMSQVDSQEWAKTVRKSGFVGSYTLPVVKVGEASIVGNPAGMDDVTKAMDVQGKLPFEYVIQRLGFRLAINLFLGITWLFYGWLFSLLIRIFFGKGKSLPSKGK